MKKTSQRFCLILFATILSSTLGCGRKSDDAKISSEIQTKFSQDSGLSSKQLTIQADHGLVTLAGVVDNTAQREAASRQASSVVGVKEVVNNLQVGAARPAAGVPALARNETASSPALAGPAPRSGGSADKGALRKNRKAHAHTDSETDSKSANDSGPSQMSAGDQPSSDAPPQIEEIASNNHVPVQSPPPPPALRRLIIDQGTQLAVRLIDPIDSEKNQTGDTFHATLNAPLTSDGEQAVPAGVELVGHLVEVKSAGKFRGQSAVVLQLDSLSSGGKTYSLQTDQYRKEGTSRGKNTAEKVGGGAIIGGIIGAIAGGGRGAAIGSAAGAGVGAGSQEISKSQQIKLPSETVLNFTLQAPITVVQAASPDASRPKLDAQ